MKTAEYILGLIFKSPHGLFSSVINYISFFMKHHLLKRLKRAEESPAALCTLPALEPLAPLHTNAFTLPLMSA